MNDYERSIEDRRLAEEKATQDKLDLVRAYKATFKSPEGKKVLLDLMKSCHFTSPTFRPHASDITMQIAEGRRSVVTDILAILETSEEQVLQFLYDRTEDEEGDII